MTRHKSLLTKVSSFLMLLSLFFRKRLAYDIESAIKRKISPVGPNVYLGFEGIKSKIAFFLTMKLSQNFSVGSNQFFSSI